MKKAKFFFVPAFSIGYALVWSLGIECLLNLMGMAMAISPDSASVTEQLPRLIPFCVIVGVLALAALVSILILNLKVSEKYSFTKEIWWTQMVIAFIISIPMIKPWEMLFDLWQKTL